MLERLRIRIMQLEPVIDFTDDTGHRVEVFLTSALQTSFLLLLWIKEIDLAVLSVSDLIGQSSVDAENQSTLTRTN